MPWKWIRHPDEGSLEGLGGYKWWIAILNSELRVCLIETGIFHQRLKGKNHADIWEKSIEGRGNSNWKGSETRSRAQSSKWMEQKG